MNREFAANLNRLMAENDIKPTALARVCGVERQTVYNWLGGVTPREEPLQRLCEYFRLTRAELLFDRVEFSNERLAEIIELVEKSAAASKVRLSAAKKAKLITLLYERAASGRPPTRREVNDLVAISA